MLVNQKSQLMLVCCREYTAGADERRFTGFRYIDEYRQSTYRSRGSVQV